MGLLCVLAPFSGAVKNGCIGLSWLGPIEGDVTAISLVEEYLVGCKDLLFTAILVDQDLAG